MGKAMVERLLETGTDVVVYNRSREKTDAFLKTWNESRIKNQELRENMNKSHDSSFMIHDSWGNLTGIDRLKDLVKSLPAPRIIWLMVPHGEPVDEMIGKLLEAGTGKGDIIIDGGNSFYEDSVRRYNSLKQKGIHFLDAGTSGGLEGARNGACLMIGGEKQIYEKVKPLFSALAGATGTETYFGPAGAGHFVKMVHNGVEYGMLEAIGEGFEVMARGPYKLNLHDAAENWSKGSVVRGWLMNLLERALRDTSALVNTIGAIGGGETGKWTVTTAKKYNARVPAIEASLGARKQSLEKPTISGKIISILRNQFGGHDIRIKNKESRSMGKKLK